MKRYLKIMCRFIIVQCIAVIMIYCFQIYAKERYENPKLKREDDYVIEWHDKNLEKAIREQTRIETGNIKLSDLWKYKKLDFYNKGIKSIEDLKNLKSLVEISLSDNEIEDISPLKDLYLLESLNLSNNYILESKKFYIIKKPGNPSRLLTYPVAPELFALYAIPVVFP